MRLILRNHTKKLRWFAVPEHLAQRLVDETTVSVRELRAFKEASAALYFRFSGDQSFTVLPVWPKGSLQLNGWVVDGDASSAKVHIWALDQLLVDGHRISESEKVNPHQLISDPTQIRRLKTKSYEPAVKARLLAHEKFTRPLGKPWRAPSNTLFQFDGGPVGHVWGDPVRLLPQHFQRVSSPIGVDDPQGGFRLAGHDDLFVPYGTLQEAESTQIVGQLLVGHVAASGAK